jgi:hypothetical protein
MIRKLKSGKYRLYSNFTDALPALSTKVFIEVRCTQTYREQRISNHRI